MDILRNTLLVSTPKRAVTLLLVTITWLLLEYCDVINYSSLEELRIDILHRKQLFEQWPPDIQKTKKNLHVFNSQDLVDSLEILLNEKLSKNNVSAEEFELFEIAAPQVKPKLKKRLLINSIEAFMSGEMTTIDGTVVKQPISKNKLNHTAIKVNSSEVLHFAFVGDSRIRQLFTMFLKAIPNYDRFTFPYRIDVTAQVSIPNQVITFSQLTSTIVSYSWHPLLRDNADRDYVDFVKNWLHGNFSVPTSSKTDPRIPVPLPDYLLIGSFVHHMLEDNKHHEQVFLSELDELAPVLKEMSKDCNIVWLNQYPTIEAFSPSDSHPTHVHSQKILQYNLRVNNILRKSGIQVWNSASVLVEEYIRSCAINRHQDGGFKRYFGCGDYIHPGTSATSDMIQILYNHWLPRRSV